MKKYIKIIITGIVMLFLCVACVTWIWVVHEPNAKSNIEFSRYEWAELLCENYELDTSEISAPYYEDVKEDNIYFNCVQAACRDGFLPQGTLFEGEKPCTMEYALRSLMIKFDEAQICNYFGKLKLEPDDYLIFARETNIIGDEDLSMELDREDGVSLIRKVNEVSEKMNIHKEVENEENEDICEVYQAYADYLETQKIHDQFEIGEYCTESWGQKNELVFSLEYIDEDNVPELIYGPTNGTLGSDIYILSYSDGQVRKTGPIGSYSQISFWEYSNLCCDYNMSMDYEDIFYFRIASDGEVESVCRSSSHYSGGEYSEEPDQEEYYIGDSIVSKDQYEEFVDSLIDGKKEIVWSSYDNANGYTVMNKDTIEDLKVK